MEHRSVQLPLRKNFHQKKMGELERRSIPTPPEWRGNKEEQIIGTQDKPQWIVAQRLLSHLQYLDATKSSIKDLSLSPFNLMISWQ